MSNMPFLSRRYDTEMNTFITGVICFGTSRRGDRKAQTQTLLFLCPCGIRKGGLWCTRCMGGCAMGVMSLCGEWMVYYVCVTCEAGVG